MRSADRDDGPKRRDGDAGVGLCLACRHGRLVPTPRVIYWLCERAASDPRYEKYPRLPVLSCPGYEPRAGE